MISLDDVYRARETLGDRLHRTPVFTSRALSERTGTRAFLKAELFQKTGSFKPRGVLARIAGLTPGERAAGVVTWSAGNAAQAVAYAAAREDIACRVFMWRSANPLKVAATRAYGATVDLEAEGPAEAHERLLAFVATTGSTFVHPFDDPTLQAGHGTIGLEILEDVPDADVVVCPVGGGGLISGLATAVKELRPACRVIGVEPEGSTALSTALAAGRIVPVTSRTIADGLGAPFTGENVLAVCRERLDGVALVSEGEIEEGMQFLYGRAKLACEPAGAAAAAALLSGKIGLEAEETVVAVVSGGNVDPDVAARVLGAANRQTSAPA